MCMSFDSQVMNNVNYLLTLERMTSQDNCYNLCFISSGLNSESGPQLAS